MKNHQTERWQFCQVLQENASWNNRLPWIFADICNILTTTVHFLRDNSLWQALRNIGGRLGLVPTSLGSFLNPIPIEGQIMPTIWECPNPLFNRCVGPVWLYDLEMQQHLALHVTFCILAWIYGGYIIVLSIHFPPFFYFFSCLQKKFLIYFLGLCLF